MPSRLPSVRLGLGTWSALQARLNWVYEGEVPPTGRNRLVRGGSAFSAWLLLEGSAEAWAGRRRVAARAGEWMVPPLPPRRQRFSAGARLLSVGFQLAWPSGEPLFPGLPGLVFPSRRFPRLERAARALLLSARRPAPADVAAFIDRPATLSSHLRLQHRLLEWVEAFAAVLEALGCPPARIGPVDGRLLRAMEALDGAGGRAPRRAAAMAAGLSPSQLDRLFVAQLGLTPRAYVDRRKLDAARGALEGSRASVKEIGYGLGFRQPTHFAAWFRRHQGESPRAYRAGRIGRLA